MATRYWMKTLKPGSGGQCLARRDLRYDGHEVGKRMDRTGGASLLPADDGQSQGVPDRRKLEVQIEPLPSDLPVVLGPSHLDVGRRESAAARTAATNPSRPGRG